MTDKAKYWIDLAEEDISVAQVLLDSGKLLYSGFMCHLSVEKALKAKMESLGKTPSKIHNLIRLADLCNLISVMSDEQNSLLDTLNPLQIEARYPAYKRDIENLLSLDECSNLLKQTKEMVEWIEKQL